MKTVKWEEGGKGATRNYPGEMLLHSSKVIPGMRVTAKYKSESIQLRILQETEPENFKASVIGHYFLGEPEALSDGDEVIIDREHILWLHGRD